MTRPGFYRAFEDRYRGSRELIGQRLLAYLPFIQPLQALHTPATALDLGCGRGEWLELLRREGWQAQGVDLDADMLADCTARGLNVAHADALSCLRAQADASLSVVSAFHVAEHLPFEALQALVAQALRVLRPGGLLILETPNPENLVVGTSGFYLDPTHLRPLPPRLLAFLPEHQGFARVCTLRLNEPPALHARTAIGLIDVLHGVSPDYAIVAQKADAPETMAALDTAFATPVGLGLSELAQRHDHRLAELEHQVNRLLAQQHQEIQALRASWSWRITAPLRSAQTWMQGVSPERLLQLPLRFVLRRPRLTRALSQVLGRLPRLRSWLGMRWRAAPAPATGDAFDRFVQHKLRITPRPQSPRVGLEQARRLMDERVTGQLLHSAQMPVHQGLWLALKQHAQVSLTTDLTDSDRTHAELLVRHVYLALLKRYPHRDDEAFKARQLIHGMTLEALIADLTASAEFRSRNIRPDL
ncbi:hypothetical protein CCO03_02120 [Comamonas serinivorans]|uniref:Methyltransferase type 11 domain-containing protein n=1 Tax=Comamonas serinivorans TaxID=1082851 RepID=A0A1Y0ESM6_9BURK|nr:methyltransferase domain-containing protein [Comamonas serinivorans]ARU06586.1 hypothetical protein CCO03_02120 [Comamonas serinivorans]